MPSTSSENIHQTEARLTDAGELTAAEVFDALLAAATMPAARERYRSMETTLVVAVEQRLRHTKVNFSGLFQKIDFLMKTSRDEVVGHSLYFAINSVRLRMKSLETAEDAELERDFPADLHAVAAFVALIYHETIPPRLAELFASVPLRMMSERLKDGTGRAINSIRAVVERWDEGNIYCRREDTGGEITVGIKQMERGFVPGDWTYLLKLIAPGDMLCLVRPKRSADGGVAVVPELIIFAPDYLVNVTSVAACFEPCGHSPFAELINRIKPSADTMPTLLGNFASQLLDETVYGLDLPYPESVKSFFRRNALSFLALSPGGEKAESFHEAAKRQRDNIKRLLGDTNGGATLKRLLGRGVILEPSFFSPTLGLQGRMDLIDFDCDAVVEQKSGKGKYRPGMPDDRFPGVQEKHLVQTLLYRALLHYDYEAVTYDKLHSYLLYSKYTDGLADVASAPTLLFEAMKVRNGIARCGFLYAEKGMGFLARLTPEKLYPDAAGPLWERFTRPELEKLLSPIRNAAPAERAYILRFLRFVAQEQLLAKLGNRTKENSGFASVWNSSLDEKRRAGNIYEHLKIEISATSHIEELAFITEDTGAADMSNFRKGDIVFFYPYRPGSEPDATKSMVFRASVAELRPGKISLHLRNPQTSRSVFDHYRGAQWAIEHDFMEASFSSLYRAVVSFASASPRRRSLLMGTARPETDTALTLLGDYSPGGGEEFNRLVLHAKQARDLFLIIGPPGTGKTSYGMKNLVLETLLEPTNTVLLLSYTNRAVDEICGKLESIENLDYIRLGSDWNCEERYRRRLLANRVADCENLNDVKRLIDGVRVVCATVTAVNSNMQLLAVKHFDLAIVDEASQILEPHIIGLLSAQSGGREAIGKFVLIGDEKQLPAVVQQTAEESRVEEPELRDIGLTDCANSLFERMLRLYAYRPDGTIDESVCFMLRRQGRMHPEIADFPNKAFYRGELKPVPLPHQLEETRESMAVGAIGRLITGRRVAFIDCPTTDCGTEADKVNIEEANIIAATAMAQYRKEGTNFDPLRSVGVIVPYRNQIATVREEMARYGVEALLDVTVDTVERFQGSQRDMIIYGFTAKRPYQLSFLTSNEYVDPLTGALIDRKLNVAMTRAMRSLILVGNARLLSRAETFSRMIEYARREGNFISVTADDYAEGNFTI